MPLVQEKTEARGNFKGAGLVRSVLEADQHTFPYRWRQLGDPNIAVLELPISHFSSVDTESYNPWG